MLLRVMYEPENHEFGAVYFLGVKNLKFNLGFLK